ncbi:MAG: GntR family transcriptional regulator [Caulobacteraceae bacterium]
MAISERASADFSVFARVERETLQDQVYLQLRQALMAGRFQPGQAFTLRSVAEALGVSHMPVRSAMQRLGAEGALEAPPSGRTLIVPELRKANLQELRDIRVEIEGFAAQRAADRVSGEELIQIERRAHLMQAAAIVGDLDAYIQENWAFHTAVYRASHMDLLLGLIEGLWLRIGPYVRLMVPDRAAMIASMPNHHEIYRALRDRDGAGARESIAADLLESSHHLEAVLPQ